MNESVKKDILAILRESIEVLREREDKDVVELHDISNHTIHAASIYQDQDAIQIAVVIYAIYKIFQRGASDAMYAGFQSKLMVAQKNLQADDLKSYHSAIRGMFSDLSKVDQKLKLYIEDVIIMAKIKKGSKLFEHGLSVAQASEILGISHWELMNYLGKTTMFDDIPKGDVSARLELARGIFGVK